MYKKNVAIKRKRKFIASGQNNTKKQIFSKLISNKRYQKGAQGSVTHTGHRNSACFKHKNFLQILQK